MMQSRMWTAILVGVILLSAAAGLALILLGGEPSSSPTPTLTSASAATDFPTASPIPLPSPTPIPFTYTVQDGDTLSSIAVAYGVSLDELIAANSSIDPHLIHVGQQVVIPGRFAPTPAESPTPSPLLPTEPLLTPLPTPTSSGPPIVEIAGVLRAGNLDLEVVFVRNRGGAVSLADWTLTNAAENRFVFPRLTLFPGSEVVIHSASGQSTPTDLYWGRGTPAWDSGELLTLRDQEGTVVDTYIVP